MKINKLLGTVVLCSSLLLAVSCSTKKGFESNSAPRTTLTAQEALLLNRLEKIDNEQSIMISNLRVLEQSMSTSERKIFNKITEEKFSEEDLIRINRILDGDLEDTSDLSEDEIVELERVKNELAAIAIELAETARKEAAKQARLADPNSKDFEDKSKNKITLNITSEGNKLELLSSEQGDILVYSNRSIVDGVEYVLSFSKDIADISDEKPSQVYLNDELLESREAQITCIDRNKCSAVSVVLITGQDKKVSAPMVFTKVNGEYKQIKKARLVEDQTVSPDDVIKHQNSEKHDSTYDEILEQDRHNISEEAIEDKMRTSGLSSDVAKGFITREVARQQALKALIAEKANENAPLFSDEEIEERISSLDLRVGVEQGFFTEADARKEAIESLKNDQLLSH